MHIVFVAGWFVFLAVTTGGVFYALLRKEYETAGFVGLVFIALCVALAMFATKGA